MDHLIGHPIDGSDNLEHLVVGDKAIAVYVVQLERPCCFRLSVVAKIEERDGGQTVSVVGIATIDSAAKLQGGDGILW